MGPVLPWYSASTLWYILPKALFTPGCAAT